MQDLRTRRAFLAFSPEQKETIELEYRRHVMACHRSGCEPDPRFLPELVADVRSGIHFKEEVFAKAA
jgi:hypothetical protein